MKADEKTDTPELRHRKPARRRADVSPEVVAALNLGHLETLNLVEALAMDLGALFQAAFPGSGPLRVEPTATYTAKMRQGGRQILESGLLDSAIAHSSDTVRGMGAYAIGYDAELDLEAKVARALPLAADHHFAVREWAWIGIRDALVQSASDAIRELSPLAKDLNPNLRRFASEATRPRGVWCAHFQALKTDPSPGLAILGPLKSDPSRYVQDSVANWLNDASKTRPDWVRELASRWRQQSPTASTERILKRGLRSLA